MKSPQENDATEGTTRDATPASSDATQDATLWLSVARVAQLEGVSVRAVQRRCQSGKYRARRTQTPQGERLEVDATTLATRGATPAKNDATHATQRHDAGDGEPEKRRDARDALGIAAPVPETQNSQGRDFAARYVERLESENDFLRRALEQRDRDAAELRAALREALKASPRQLDAPTDTPETSPAHAPRDAPSDSDSSPNAQTPASSPQDAKGRMPAKELRPLWKVVLGIR